MAEDTGSNDPVELATELTIAWLANPNTKASGEDVPAFLQSMHRAVINLTAAPVAQAAAGPEYSPAITVRRSLSSKDHIISLIDGKPYKTLRRHLSRPGLTPEQCRELYNLKPDYPIVAESYSQVRRDMAKKIGLHTSSATLDLMDQGVPHGRDGTTDRSSLHCCRQNNACASRGECPAPSAHRAIFEQSSIPRIWLKGADGEHRTYISISW